MKKLTISVNLQNENFLKNLVNILEKESLDLVDNQVRKIKWRKKLFIQKI